MTLIVGTSGFGYKEWKGSFYPEKLPANQMLNYYGQQFRAVEINYTFNRTPTEPLLKSWASAVPANFQFTLKAPQQITHRKRLKETDDAVERFFKIAVLLKKRLGPVLFQLPPNFKKDAERLRTFLASLPPKRRVTFEFRHESWFDDEIFTLLRDHRAALCIAADERLETPFQPTTDWGFLRLRHADYNAAAMRKWVKQVKKQNWRDTFVFFRHEEQGNAPKLAKRFLELAEG